MAPCLARRGAIFELGLCFSIRPPLHKPDRFPKGLADRNDKIAQLVALCQVVPGHRWLLHDLEALEPQQVLQENRSLAAQYTLADSGGAHRQSSSSPRQPDPLVASSINLLQWWLDQSMPYPAERMGQICQ
ncbi:MAG: hypothetical protein M3R24_01945 [Chloroflexota bacterium]|nr:hypothetical protein [Chloroflexota bacterium]